MAEATLTEEIGDVHACKINKKDFTVTVTNTHLRWCVEGSKEKKDLRNIRIKDVLSAKLHSSTTTATDNDSVYISYVKEEKKLHLKLCSVVFTCANLQLVTKLHQQVIDVVGKVQQRPKKLLVLINPVSGRSKARAVYMQKVAPIFQDAGIETEVIVTEKAHHTEEILSAYNITTIDGLVLVGGDGLYHEAVNGLIQKLSKEQGLNVDDPEISLPEINLRIGLIPCGTGNGIAVMCYGNYDVVTAALSIAIGHQLESNVISVHSGGRLVAYSILLVGYGAWGDLIHTAESRRDQGVFRYPIAMLQHALIKPLRGMNLTIQCVGKAPPGNKVTETDNKDTATEIAHDDQKIEGHVCKETEITDQSSPESTIRNENVIGAIIFLYNPASQLSQPNTSQLTMFLTTSQQRRKYVSFMFHLMMLNFERIERREDVVVVPGNVWDVKLNEPSDAETENGQLEHLMNIDGEVFRIPQPGFKAKLLPQKIQLFSNVPYATKREKSK